MRYLKLKLGKSLEIKNYDQAIVLPNSLKSSLVPFFAGIPLRTGWRGEMRYFLLNDIRRLNKITHPRMVDRFVALGLKEKDKLPSDIPYPSLLGNEANINKLSSSHGIDLSKPLIKVKFWGWLSQNVLTIDVVDVHCNRALGRFFLECHRPPIGVRNGC